jgi:hypothetical protein
MPYECCQSWILMASKKCTSATQDGLMSSIGGRKKVACWV